MRFSLDSIDDKIKLFKALIHQKVGDTNILLDNYFPLAIKWAKDELALKYISMDINIIFTNNKYIRLDVSNHFNKKFEEYDLKINFNVKTGEYTVIGISTIDNNDKIAIEHSKGFNEFIICLEKIFDINLEEVKL